MLGRIEVEQDWAGAIGKHALPEDVDQWRTAVVLSLSVGSAEIGFPDHPECAITGVEVGQTPR